MNKNEQKIKVLFIITKSNWGGAQKYVYELATGLDREQFEPVVALGGKGVLAKKLRAEGVRVIYLASLERDINPLRDFASFRDLLRLMRDQHPDAVHLNSSKIGGLGSLAARIAGIPRIIFTAHGWAFNEDRSFVSRLIIKFLYYMTIRLSDATIAVSKSVAAQAPAWKMKNKVSVINLPASLGDARLERQAAREHLTQKTPSLAEDKRLWVGIVAELHKNKGITYAIESMRDSELQKNIVLIILGAGQEAAVLKNQISASGLEESVFLLGFEPEAANLMSAFDIFLLPSVTEAFGYVLLEAGFSDLPVIASRVGGIPEIIEDHKTGLLVEPRDPNAIRDALNYLTNSPTIRAELGSSLHTRILREFSPRAIISKTAELYKTNSSAA